MVDTPSRLTTLAGSNRLYSLCRSLMAFALIAFVWLLGPTASLVKAQSSLDAFGIPPFTTALPVENGFINVRNGELHLEIPLGSYSERAGRQFKAVLMYDSNILYCVDVGLCNFINVLDGNGSYYSAMTGWRLITSAHGGRPYYTAAYQACVIGRNTYGTQLITYNNFSWTGPDGTGHSFPGIQTKQGFQVGHWCDARNSSIPNSDDISRDGSGYHMYVTNFTNVSVYAPDGSRVTEDSNGNYYSNNFSIGTGAGTATDSSGRTLVTVTINGNQIYYDVLNSQGTTSRYTVTTEKITTNAYGTTSTGHTVIQSIQLPDLTTYQFGYDAGSTGAHYGQLTSITLPTGGQVFYSYKLLDPSGAYGYSPRVATRTAPDSSIPWTYTTKVVVGGLSCQLQLTVKKPSGDSEVYTVSRGNYGGDCTWPTAAQYYSGSVSSANLLAATTAEYAFSGSGGHKSAETTTLPTPSGTSLNQRTEYTWDTFGPGGISRYAQLLQKREWNFYSGTRPTNPDRTTNIAYVTGSANGSAYAAVNIVNLPTSVTVTNSSGGIVSQTVNSYDDWPLATSGATGIVNHDDTNYGANNNVRGNLTQTKRWVNTTGAWLVTKNYYDMVGNLIQTTDPNGNSTYFDHTDNYYGSSPSPATAAYVTKITKPVTNGANHIERAQYYLGSGHVAAKCGENFASTCAYGLSAPQSDYTSYAYDSMERPATINAGDGDQTSWSYASNSSTTTTKIDASNNFVKTTILDGLGRAFQTQTSSGQGTVYVDTTYDSNGRVRTVSNPHFSTSSSTDGTTIYSSYDGLDRVLVLTKQDGSTVTTSYAGNCKTVTDEALKARKSCFDGFGRLTGVWEDPAALNYETDYQYDLLSNLTSVTQSGSRQRTFVYDSLSRLSQATNPESGTINYTYDANGNVKTKTDARNITTTWAYDALNRFTSKTYSDGTPGVVPAYDMSNPFGLSASNTIGRMVGLWESDNVWLSWKAFSYDSMG